MGNDFLTPALYFFSTVAQTMGAIIAIVLASVYAIIPQIQQRNDNVESSVLIRLLQKDDQFINSVLYGFSSIIISISFILCIYIFRIQSIASIILFGLFAITSLTCMIIACVYIWIFVTKRVKIYSTINNIIENRFEISYKKKDTIVDYIYVNILYYSRNKENIHELVDYKTFSFDKLINTYGEEKFYEDLVNAYINDNRVSQIKDKSVLYTYLFFIYFHDNNLKLQICNKYIIRLLYFYNLESEEINDLLLVLHRFDIEKITILNEKSFIYNRLLFHQSIMKYYAFESEKYSKNIFEIMHKSLIKEITHESLDFLYQQDLSVMLDLLVYIWIILLSSKETLINNVIIEEFFGKSKMIAEWLILYSRINSINLYQNIENETDSLLKMKQISELTVICYMFGLEPLTRIIIPKLNSVYIGRKYSLDGNYELSIKTITEKINRIKHICKDNPITEQDIAIFLDYSPFGKQN